MNSESGYLLQWSNHTHGPWSLDQIRKALGSGELHSLYRIQVGGTWLTLRDYLETVDAADLAHRAAAFGAGKTSYTSLDMTRQPLTAEAAPPALAQPKVLEIDDELPPTSWLSVTAFVVSCSGLLPYLNLVGWLPGIVLGHLALRQTRLAPELEGRGLAFGSLIISYAILLLAALALVFAPDLFHLVFPLLRLN